MLPFIALTLAWVLLLWNLKGDGKVALTCTVGLACAVLGPMVNGTPLALYVAAASAAAFGFLHFCMPGDLPSYGPRQPPLDGMSSAGTAAAESYLDLGCGWKMLSLVGALGSLLLAAAHGGLFK